MLRHRTNERNAVRRARAQAGPVLDHLGVGQRRQQLDGRGTQALQRLFGRRLVEAFVFQGAADQDMAVAARNRVAAARHHHRRQEVRGALEQDHLPLHRLHRQLETEALEQLATPGPRRDHHRIGTQFALCGLHADHPAVLPQETLDRALLADLDIGQLLQRRAQRLEQTRIAHVGHPGHVDRVVVAVTQHRHRRLHLVHCHLPQRPALARRPGQRLGLVFQIQPVQPGDVHLRIDPALLDQPLAEARIEILRPVRQRRHRRAVAPRIQRRNDPATGPGRLATHGGLIEQGDGAAGLRQQTRRLQANGPGADDEDVVHGEAFGETKPAPPPAELQVARTG
ncbi:hypothetical protein D3C85_1014250 [compost metagenome]